MSSAKYYEFLQKHPFAKGVVALALMIPIALYILVRCAITGFMKFLVEAGSSYVEMFRCYRSYFGFRTQARKQDVAEDTDWDAA